MKLASNAAFRPSCSRSALLALAMSSACAFSPEDVSSTSQALTSQVLEGESMTAAANSWDIESDTTASGGRDLALLSNGTATTTLTTRAVAQLTVRARGDQCQGTPQMVVTVDRATVLTANVTRTSWSDYTANVSLAAGSHRIVVSFANDLYQPHVCDRNLVIDKITLEGPATPTDAGSDAARDAVTPTDTGADVATPRDTGTDAARDTGVDASVPIDTGVDASVPVDTGVDAGRDVVVIPPGSLGITTSALTSSGVTLSWSSIPGATAVRVYLAAEPPSTAGAALPDELLVATLAGTATSQRVGSLAPSVDAFLRVEVDTSSGTIAANVHARTPGGPRATLDNAVRSVHAYGPTTLLLVLTGGTGSVWQAGPWTVQRRDGSTIAVTGVSRQSIPVSAPSYSIGYGTSSDDNVITSDHRIHLALGSALGNRDVLHVHGPSGIDLVIPYSDRYLETPVVQVNQVGYNPRASHRYAYVSGWTGSGGALSLTNFPATADVLVEPADALAVRTAALTGLSLAARTAMDADAATEVRQIDLASLAAADGVRYRVRIPGVGVSWPTAVSERAVFKSFYTLARGLYFNRWGGNLDAAHSPWVRGPDHGTIYTGELTDLNAYYTQTTAQSGARSLVGGYHDAGDFDQRPMHTVVAQLVMRAYELNRASFADGQLTLPESGNGIPDLLDEALWGVSSWEQLQEADGGVRMGAQSWRQPWGYYHADDEPLPYWTFAREANTTARAAGLFAQASRLVAPFDATHAASLRSRAISAWTYATGHGATNPYRLYASGELYRLTGDATYRTAFETAWSAMGTYGAFSNFVTDQGYQGDYQNGNRAMPDYLQSYLASAGASASIVSTSQSWLTSFANTAATRVDSDHAHRNPRPAGSAMDWGHGTTGVRDLDTVIARMQLGGLDAATQQRYFDALSQAADYLLGCNPNGLVYVSGLGSRNVVEPLHLDSLTFIKEGQGPMAGIPVFGPCTSLPNVSYTQGASNAFYPAFGSLPPGLRYADVRTVPATNEFSVWESQAPDVELFGVLLGSGMSPPSSWLPTGTDARNPLP